LTNGKMQRESYEIESVEKTAESRLGPTQSRNEAGTNQQFRRRPGLLCCPREKKKAALLGRPFSAQVAGD